MAISPLAATLFGANDGGANSLLALDPSIATAIPDYQLGTTMQQQGLSTDPAYAPQAVSRLAQAIAGTFLRSSALSDLSKASANMPSHMADILEKTQPGNPVIPMLRSDDPYVRMTGMQLMQKTVPLQSELQKTTPNETVSTGPTTVFNNQNPRTKLAQTMADAEAAAARGDNTTADVLTSGANKDISTEGGVRFSSIPLGIPRVSAPPSPTAAIPPPEKPTPDQIGAAKQKLAQRLNDATIAGIVSPTTTGVAGQEVPKDADRVPVANGPNKAPGPTTMPEAIAQAKGMQAASEKLYGGASEALGKAIGETIEAGGKNARDRMNALNTIQDALNVGGKGVTTGPLADRALRAKEALDAFGIDTSWVKSGLPESEVISKMNAQLASASAKAMTGRPTQFEFSAWMKNNPGLLTSKEGTTALINVLKQATQQDIDVGRLAQNKGNWEKWADTVDDYYKKHPLISPFTNKAMAQEVAAPTRRVTATNKQTGARMQSFDRGATWQPLQAQ